MLLAVTVLCGPAGGSGRPHEERGEGYKEGARREGVGYDTPPAADTLVQAP